MASSNAWPGPGLGSLDGHRRCPVVTRTGPDDDRAGLPRGFPFVQISDTHIGFKGDANPDVLGTFHDAIAKINVIDPAPAFVLHTGDLSHTQKPGAFDTVTESLKGVKTDRVFYVPGENDVFADGGKEYLSRYGQGTVGGRGWQSFDYHGVHFIGLVNVLTYQADHLGALGDDQLKWLEKDVAGAAAACRSWSSPTCRSGPSTPSGGGPPAMASRPCPISSASGRSPS